MSEQVRNIKTREGYEIWDKLCAIPRYGFIHSPDNSRVLKAEGLGNWIDQHAAQQVVDQAQDEVNELRASHAADEVRISELEGLLRKLHSDLLMRAEVDADGVKVVNLSNGLWCRVAALAQQESER